MFKKITKIYQNNLIFLQKRNRQLHRNLEHLLCRGRLVEKVLAWHLNSNHYPWLLALILNFSFAFHTALISHLDLLASFQKPTKLKIGLNSEETCTLIDAAVSLAASRWVFNVNIVIPRGCLSRIKAWHTLWALVSGKPCSPSAKTRWHDGKKHCYQVFMPILDTRFW